MKLDLSTEKLGCVLPDELAHLEQYAKYAKKVGDDLYAFYIPQWFDDGTPNVLWWEFRKETLGASSAATLTGHDEYGDKVKLFWEKVGLEFPMVNTKFTVAGSLNEENIGKLWESHDGTAEGYVDNFFNGVKVRERLDVPFYLVNTNYPRLSVSLDFYCPPGQVSPFTDEVINFGFPIECKNISYFAAQKYENSIPARYIIQLNQQMFVTGVTYSEIAFMIGGFDFNVLPSELDLEICQEIISEAYDFWDRVLQARPLYEEMKSLEMEYDKASGKEKEDLMNQITELDKSISKLEPEPSGNPAFQEFFTLRYKESLEDAKRQGTEEEWDLAVEYKTCGDKIKELKDKQEELKNKLLASTRYDETVDFGENGRILNKRYSEKRNVFRVGIKNYK